MRATRLISVDRLHRRCDTGSFKNDVGRYKLKAVIFSGGAQYYVWSV
ncbi:MAG TPA: hypothetical protein VGD05_03035 [Pyrinomonadaceae bacterium]